MKEILEKHIAQYFKGTTQLSKSALVRAIQLDFPSWSFNTVSMYLSQLKKRGLVHSPSRGTYALTESRAFSPLVTNRLIKCYAKIKQKFPFLTCCIWETSWLHEFMLQQPFKQYTIIEVEKEAAASVFHFLKTSKNNVFLNPDQHTFEQYINSSDHIIIVQNLVSEAPIIEKDHIVIPSLEKLLVDMFIDKHLFAAQQDEKLDLLKSAAEKVTLNELRLKRYAIRRNRKQEFEEIIRLHVR